MRCVALLAILAGCGDASRRDEADRHYRAGIELLRAGKPGAREELSAGAELAPMDPALYLPLARACRERSLSHRAAEFYRKYLRHAPGDRAVEAELASLGSIEDPFAPELPLTLPIAIAAGAILVGGTLLLRRRRRERRTLAELAAEHPELHPAIAFLVGSLRHELFKHRVLAVGDAVRALARGETQPGLREFLVARLTRGEPLLVAWAGHLGAFLRALGPRFDLVRNDPAFRDAGRALDELTSSLALPDGAAAMARAHARLTAFDAALGAQLKQWTHTALDDALMRALVDEVRGELPLDDLALAPVPPGISVEIYRVDLVLVLKNLLRNAMSAAARGPAPRRVLVAVDVTLEPTGDEIVRVRVSDTNPEPLPASQAQGRGLGLVRTALSRADGTLEVAPAADGFAKCVAVRLFRALDERAAEEAA